MGLDFALSDAHRAVQERTRAALEPLRSRRAEILEKERTREYPEEVWAALAEAGFFAAAVPPGDGGTGEGLLAMVLAMEALGTVGYQNVLPGLTALATFSIARAGSEALKARVLPAIAAGRCKIAFASTEAAAGFNIFRTQTLATRDGDEYRLRGTKTFISGAEVADYLLVISRSTAFDACRDRGLPKTFGLCVFLVDARAPGISRRKMHTRGEGYVWQWDLEFEDVPVSVADRIGEEDAGVLAMMASFSVERILFAAMSVGASQYCLDIACPQVRERVVFGERPIGSYQAIQHPLAEVKLRQEAARLMTYKAAWLFDSGADVREIGFAANSAKYLCTELGLRSADAAIDALGGRGFDEAHGLIHLWEHARLLQTAPVSDHMILNDIAQHQLGLPRSY